MRARDFFAAGLLLGCAAAAGQTLAVEAPSCLPVEENGLLHATVSGLGTGQSARLYFRWREQQDPKEQGSPDPFYWVAMEPEAGERYWVIPPKAEKRNKAVEYYGAIADPGGKVVARSDTQWTKVTSDCRVPLNARERGVAQNLTIGETKATQQNDKVYGFLCDGVVTRVNFENLRRADEACRACVVAWWRTGVIPATLGTAGLVSIIAVDNNPPSPEPSPSRPPG